jgi:VWFA-related protein
MSCIHPRRGLWVVAVACALGAGPGPRAQTAAGQNPQAPRERIKVGVDLVTTPVTVRDRQGQFLADLKYNEFELYEDGVRQTLVTFSLSHGGRIFDVARPPAQVLEGIVLPATRPANDTSGRIFLIFIDDQHLEASQTPRVRDLFARITKRLVHEGDMFGIVSTGPSSIAFDLTYDRKRLDQAAEKIVGNGLSPQDVISTPSGSDGSAEVRHRVHVAFSTAYDLMRNLAHIHDRRKAMIYVSNGYDLNPFADERKKAEKERAGDVDVNPFGSQSKFSDADLVSQLSELTRAAVRANVSIFTIDPRGLTAGPDISQPIDMVSYQKHVSKTQDTLRVLADETGGIAVVNRNDFDKALDRIDAETSDYYMLGYYSSNNDASRRKRKIEIKITRPGVEVRHRTEYSLKPTAR